MKEDFISFIWQHQYFDKTNLKTWQGEVLQIIDPGTRNSNAGPDFSNARLKIGSLEWQGPVEIHVKASDWWLHKHHLDPVYEQVILHVVWSNDLASKPHLISFIPLLELKTRVDIRSRLTSFHGFSGDKFIPCRPHLSLVPTRLFASMLALAFAQRIERKSSEILKALVKTNNDWEQVTYERVGRNFGFKVNEDVFEALVKLVPLRLVDRLRSNILQLEALYFGQAGMLTANKADWYYRRLQSEYLYLKRKYPFISTPLKKQRWRYLRLRPANFPTIRIAQFASLMHHQYLRFSDVREASSIRVLLEPQIEPSSYWTYHYDFAKPREMRSGRLGKSSKCNLIINSVAPILAAYAVSTGQPKYLKQAQVLLTELPPENNHIVSNWKDWGFEVTSAYCSQALIELNNRYCNRKRCLNCGIGQHILSGSELH